MSISTPPPNRSAARWLLATLLVSAPTIAACEGDLFNDTSWIENVCPTGEGPRSAPCVLDATPAIFLRNAGDDAAAGTRDAPVATLARAVALASANGGPRRIYACAETFAESVALPSGTEIYGGLDCNNGWAGLPQVRTLIAPPSPTLGVPMILLEGTGVSRLEDVEIIAPDASEPGASSIAVIAAATTAVITRSVMTAGRGMAGAAGGAGTAPPPSIAKGNEGGNACEPPTDVGTLGGSAVALECGEETSVGAAGGTSPPGSSTAGAGGGGEPLTDAGGAGGQGQPSGTSSWDCASSGQGEDGSAGAPGEPGAGASAVGEASVSGFAAAGGAPGGIGKVGQGGGGGGATTGNGCAAGQPGAGGGSGGPGGCGGAPGGGGGGGGASIALLSVGASVTVRQCVLQASDGGLGGDGALGGAGMAGVAGGNGGAGWGAVETGCKGGAGGVGGTGGIGGGGRGGHSVGIAFAGTPVVQEETGIFTAPTSAPGGLGGGGEMSNAGAAGVNSPVLDLTAPAI